MTTVPQPAPSLSSLYLAPASESATPAAQSFFSASKLPPNPVSGIKLSWQPSAEKIERDPYTYFPMVSSSAGELRLKATDTDRRIQDNFSSTVIDQAAAYGHETARTGISNHVNQKA